MKAKDIIERAFSEVNQSKLEAAPVDLVDGLRYLNRMMARLQAQGIDVNYKKLSNPEDQLTSPISLTLSLVKNLAVSLWPQYNTKPLNPALKFWADRSLDSMRSQAIDGISAAQFPATLPLGSGNYQGIYQENFYGNVRGQSISIAKEENTNG